MSSSAAGGDGPPPSGPGVVRPFSSRSSRSASRFGRQERQRAVNEQFQEEIQQVAEGNKIIIDTPALTFADLYVLMQIWMSEFGSAIPLADQWRRGPEVGWAQCSKAAAVPAILLPRPVAAQLSRRPAN
jgi:hypothetical protein